MSVKAIKEECRHMQRQAENITILEILSISFPTINTTLASTKEQPKDMKKVILFIWCLMKVCLIIQSVQMFVMFLPHFHCKCIIKGTF